MTKNPKLQQTLTTLATLWLLIGASMEVYQAGWGSGHWIGRFSSKWAATFLGFELFFILILAAVMVVLWFPQRRINSRKILSDFRLRLSWGRWVIAAAAVVFMPWFFLYSSYGSIFAGSNLRFVFFMVTVGVVAWMATKTERILIDWPQVLASFVIVGSGFAFAKLFVGVTDYPFSLYWSEGNRLWDYSLLYRPELYDYTVNELSSGVSFRVGRSLLYGLPYLLPNFSILGLRLWNALLFSIPYAVFGWGSIALPKSSRIHWVLFGLWVFIFLNQGPIWASLIIIALMVSLVKQSNLWVALPVLIIAGYYAELSRSTWVFAPSIWIVMIVFAQPSIDKRGLKSYDWMRAILLGIAGVVGSFLIPQSGILQDRLGRFSENIQFLLTQHPLLWDRLLPNNTFGTGILFGLALACLPLIILIIYLVQTRRLKFISVQKFILGLGLASFLGVGLVASVKVGGGTNLHNLDMFLLGMVFLAAIVWESGFGKDVNSLLKQSSLVRGTLILIVGVPAFVPMIGANPLILPPYENQGVALKGIQDYASCASSQGEILFMSERQLLTFGNISDVGSVINYEKKRVMDTALAENESYFESFYSDLRDSKFSLIVADRQFVVFKEGDKSLAEENNAWVKWVTIPLINEYEAVASYKLVGVELYMPIDRTFTCP